MRIAVDLCGYGMAPVSLSWVLVRRWSGDVLAVCIVVDRLARGVRQPIAAIRFAHTQCRFLIHKDFCECVVSSVRNFFERTD